MSYAAEPVPSNVDPILAEYLMRQFIGIQFGTSADEYRIPVVSEIPDREVPGALVMLNRDDGGDRTFNGVWACQPDTSGNFVWKRLLPETRNQQEKPQPKP